MNVVKDSVVSLSVELWDLWGTLLQRSETPVHYLHGGYDGIFPAVESALEGKAEGDSLEVRLEPEDAFGEYDEELVRVEPRSRFPAEVTVGMQFEGVPGDGDTDTDAAIYTVTDIGDDAVVLDGNHPFAGIALKFQCRVVGVRAATPEELDRGAADDPDDEDGIRVLH